MIPSQNCYNLIKEFEGCELEAYVDPGTGGEPITIGYGHTGGVKLGEVISQEQANEYFVSDVKRFADGVNKMVNVPMTQGEFDALCSFSFNLGLGNLKSSTLLKKLNAGNKEAAANQFLVWNMAAGRVMTGLTRRRETERALFLS